MEGLLKQLALQLHRAIVALPSQQLPEFMRDFPHGSCDPASMLLGAYLAENGFTDVDYVSGWRGRVEDGSRKSHAWLEAGEVVIDITAGQFEDAPEPIIVSSSSLWHQGFDVEKREPRDFSSFSESPCLREVYSRLKLSIDEENQQGGARRS